MGGLQVFVFPNSKEEKDTQPDARIVFAQREFKKDAEPAGEDMFGGGGGDGYEPGADG